MHSGIVLTVCSQQVRFFSANVALAVEHLSLSQIAFRDLKPENLAIRADGYLVLIDLGLVADVSEGKSHTMCGTPVCMPQSEMSIQALSPDEGVSGVHGPGAN